MIIGIGHDLTHVDRIRHLLEGRIGERFLFRVLTPAEREYATQRFGAALQGKWSEFTAGRFAAKEAVVKALGCGLGGEVGFQDMEILPTASGKPVCKLSLRSHRRLQLPSDTLIHLSITHTAELASAFAVVETS